jgi:hypothetical protein
MNTEGESPMVLCQNCQKKMPGDAKFCSNCGQPIVGIPTLDVQSTVHIPVPSSEGSEVKIIEPPVLRSAVATLPPIEQGNGLQTPVRPSEELPGITPPINLKSWLAEQRRQVVSNLLAVISFVEISKRQNDQALFEQNSSDRAPMLEHSTWHDVAFIIGVYGRSMCNKV